MWKFGVRYNNGKILFYKADNPAGMHDAPSWAVDIREIIAMCFAGIGGLAFLCLGCVGEASTILIGLMFYATGRTVPGGKPSISEAQLKIIIAEVTSQLQEKKQ